MNPSTDLLGPGLRPALTGLALAVAAALTLLVPTAAEAQSCTVSASPVSFGAYDPFYGGDVDVTGSVTVDCTEATPWVASLSAGLHSSGSFSPRKMRHASLAFFLEYELYLGPARTTVWGDGSGSTSTGSGTGDGELTVYGRLPALQNVHVGTYSDTVTVTVVY